MNLNKGDLRRIKDHLLPLWRLLPELIKRNQEYLFWKQFEYELREFLNIETNPDEIAFNPEDAYQLLLIEVYKRPEKFCPKEGDFESLLDSFFQKISLIRLAYKNHLKKEHRKYLSERIRILEMKHKTEDLCPEELRTLENLKKNKKKLQ